MNIAIVIPTQWYSDNPSKFSVDLGLYIEGIIELGHNPLLVCGQNSVFAVDYPVKIASSYELEQKTFWENFNLDLAIVFTWLRYSKILNALGEAGIYTVSRADVDGQMSVRVFPWHHYRMTINGMRNPVSMLRGFRHWVRRYFFLSRQVDKETIDSLSASNAVMIETITAKKKIEQFLTYYQRPELNGKIFVQPHYVANDLLSCEVILVRPCKIVAIGRWEDPQKNAPLMSAALQIYLQDHPETEVIIIGRNGKKVFASLLKKYPSVRYLGEIPRTEVRRHLSDCRILLFTSRWEGAPASASEALSLGATVVGPPIPGITGFCLDGQFGRVSKSYRPIHIVQAIEAEMVAWTTGIRQPAVIAKFWRPNLSAIISIKKIIQMSTHG